MGLVRVRLAAVVGVVALAFCCAACSKEEVNPLTPTPTGVAGNWVGNASDSSGPGQMTWQIAQDGSPFSGILLIVDANGGYGGKGSVNGTVSGSVLHVTLRVPQGGFDAPFESCSAEMTGDAQLGGSSITGTYTGNSSCGGAITAGQFTLTRQ